MKFWIALLITAFAATAIIPAATPAQIIKKKHQKRKIRPCRPGNMQPVSVQPGECKGSALQGRAGLLAWSRNTACACGKQGHKSVRDQSVVNGRPTIVCVRYRYKCR